ncbi:MAG: CDP-archaeol synthase [Nautiliaceae bacterium]
MRERLITSIAIVFVLVVVGVINNFYLTSLLIGIISVVGLYEAKKLFGIEDERIFYTLSLFSFLPLVIDPLVVGVLGVIGVSGYVAYFQRKINLISLALYPFLPLMLLLELYYRSGLFFVIWLIVIIALTDSFAYLIGKNFGKTFFKEGFSPTSPNKSWEGVIGGVMVGSIIGAFVGLREFNFLEAFFIAILVSIVSVFGDLFESYLKRRAGVKDSGSILPGHGGILDRIDGYLFSAPLMWAILYAMGH